MKKKLLVLFLAVVALFSVLVINAGAEEATLPETCPHCNKKVTWEPLTEANAEDIAVSGGHRYLAFEGDECYWTNKSIPKTVCLYMNGKTLIAKEGSTRLFSVNSTGILNLIGEGTVKGRAFSSTESYGGTINVVGTLNVYGTTVTTTAESGRTAGRGGVVYLSGSVSVLNLYSGNITGGKAANGGTLGIDTGVANIYGGTLGGGTATAAGGAVYIRDGGTLNVMGGTIEGGTAKTTGGAIHSHQAANLYISGGTIKGGESTKNGGTLYVNNTNGGEVIMSGGKIEGGYSGNAGGAVYINSGATFEMSGGKITGGSAKTTGPCVYVPDNAKIILSGSASIEELRFNSYEAKRVLVKGKCTGSVLFRGATGQAVDGAIVGVAEEGADLHKASYTVHNTELTLVTEGTDVKMSGVGYIDIMDSHIGYCEVCDKQVTWLSYADVDYENATYLYSGHYYVVSDDEVCEWKQKFIVGDDVVCLDLMGKTLKSNTRAFDVTKGVLNIMDSVGGGVVTGCGPTNVETVYGGTFFVREPSTLNLYGGKLTYHFPEDDRSYVARGGVVYSRGAVNVYGGEISDGAARAGSNVYIDCTADGIGHMGLYGGLVGGYVKVPGKSTSGPCIVNRGTQVLSGNGTANALMMSDSTYTPALTERITIDGAYTGSVAITLSEWDGTIDIGTAVNADVSGCNVTFAANEAKDGKLVIADGQVFILHNEPAALVRTTEGAYTVYATAAEAIAAAGNENLVILLANAENIAVEGILHVDLNGYAVNGAAGNGTLVCKDSATDDFTVADGAYGAVTGATCQLAGMTVASPCGEDNYLMITENGAASFHRVQLTVTEAVFRPATAGIYYKCSFLGDEMAEAQVKNVGIVLNASEAPTLANMETTSLYTQQGAEIFNTTGTSCLLSDILKADLADAENLARATTNVYANAYIETENGEILLGNTVCTNLQQQVNTIDAEWTYMTIQQKAAFMDMYYVYQELLGGEGWSVTNAVSIADRKNQFETIDYTPYVCPWNYDVVEAAKADGKVHYYFFAGEGLHISDGQTYKDKWGDAYLVVFPNGQTLLVDSGPLSYAPVVAENLRRMGITHLDALLVTHPHSDHHNGLFSDSAVLNIGFLQEIDIDQVYFRGGEDPDSTTEDLVSRVCRDLNIPCDVMEKGDELTFGDVRIACVWPLLGQGDAHISGGEEINNMSIVIRLDYGEHSSLLTGDLYVDGEKWILERVDQALLDVDFLKVPHHGYNTSSSVAFLNAISPELAMSIGRLPIPQKVYDRYETLGIELLDDRMCGYVEVTGAADGTLEYTTSRNGLDDETPTPDTGDEEVLPDTDED